MAQPSPFFQSTFQRHFFGSAIKLQPLSQEFFSAAILIRIFNKRCIHIILARIFICQDRSPLKTYPHLNCRLITIMECRRISINIFNSRVPPISTRPPNKLHPQQCKKLFSHNHILRISNQIGLIRETNTLNSVQVDREKQ